MQVDKWKVEKYFIRALSKENLLVNIILFDHTHTQAYTYTPPPIGHSKWIESKKTFFDENKISSTCGNQNWRCPETNSIRGSGVKSEQFLFCGFLSLSVCGHRYMHIKRNNFACNANLRSKDHFHTFAVFLFTRFVHHKHP